MAERKSFEYADLIDYLPESLWAPAWYANLKSVEDVRRLARGELADCMDLDYCQQVELRNFIERI